MTRPRRKGPRWASCGRKAGGATEARKNPSFEEGASIAFVWTRASAPAPPNAAFRAEARTHFGAKSIPHGTPCGGGHSMLHFLAPQFQTEPAALGFRLGGQEKPGGHR